MGLQETFDSTRLDIKFNGDGDHGRCERDDDGEHEFELPLNSD